MKRNKAYMVAIPATALAIGSVIFAYGHWERDKVAKEIEALFKAHVDSVALLVKEGAREASASTAATYRMTEDHLLTTAHLLTVLDSAKIENVKAPDEEWSVHLVLKEDGTLSGDWGRVPDSERGSFLAKMRDAAEGELIDDGEAGRLGLLCLRHGVEGGAAVVCRDSESLSALRREIGIGPLLKGVIKGDVLYAALQDEEGVLAVAPSSALLTDWKNDPALSAALRGGGSGGATRVRSVGDKPIFEGMIPFEMADGSTVLLRVGIDASVLRTAQKNSERRYYATAFLAFSLALISFLSTWIFWRWNLKKEEMDRALEIKEEQRSHWEEIGQMAATVAHEVRNPLNTVEMISQRLGREFTLREEERPEFDEMIRLLQSESKRVGRVVTEFLNLGGPMDLKVGAIDADHAMNDAVSPMRMRAEAEGKRLELDNRCRGEIAVDSVRFRQMIANLIDNAFDAVQQGGVVSVRSECGGSEFRIEVVDDGVGMTPKMLAEVMKPFVSFKQSGTGLGLPLVKRIAQAHGGDVEIESSPGRGTKVRIFIPRSR